MHSYKIGLYTLEEAELQQFKNSLCAERSIIQNAFIVFISKKKNAGIVCLTRKVCCHCLG